MIGIACGAEQQPLFCFHRAMLFYVRVDYRKDAVKRRPRFCPVIDRQAGKPLTDSVGR